MIVVRIVSEGVVEHDDFPLLVLHTDTACNNTAGGPSIDVLWNY